MPEHRIAVQPDSEFEPFVPIPFIHAAAQGTLRIARVADRFDVVVTIVGAEEIQRLNREYRAIDEPTDVLSFSQCEPDSFPVAPDHLEPLGDVVIAYPIAAAQAAAVGHSVERELALLTIHGVLHLLGYDHAEPDEERVMFGLQDEVLAQLGV